MNVLLLAPVGLAALASLLLPIAVHLARQPEEQPIDFAAMRWLRPKPRPRRRPRLDELLLLATRLILLALLALWLAQPVLVGDQQANSVVAVVPGVDPARVAAMIQGGARGIWLAPGFPALDRPTPEVAAPVGSLVRQIDAELPPRAALTVFSPSIITTADAERPRVSRKIFWRTMPGTVSPNTPTKIPPVALAIRTDGLKGSEYIRAAALALSRPGKSLDRAPLNAALPREGALAWWAPGDVPQSVRDWVAQGHDLLVPVSAILPAGSVTVAWRDDVGAPLAESVGVGRGHIVRFTRAFDPSEMPSLVDPVFPDRLAALVSPPKTEPKRVAASDYAPVLGAAARELDSARRAVRPGLALVIALLFGIERWLATRKRRAVAP